MSLSFSPKDPEEVIVVSFSFARVLNSGETVESCTFTVRDSHNLDVSTAMVSGLADISAAPIVKQTIQGGSPGVTYLVRAKTVTSAARTLIGSALLPVTVGGN